MSDSKQTSRKQKILITLIIITVGLLAVSLLTNGGEDGSIEPSIDRSECLQQGDVWDNTNQRCYSSAASRFPQNYVANCRGVSNNIQLNTFRDGRGQIIFSGSPADVFELQSSGPNNGSEAFVGDGLEVDFDRSSATLSLQRRGQPDTVDCSLQANRPETPAGTQATRLKIDETGSAGGITITLNNIIADNRCPVDAVCVQEGQFAVNTTLETNDLLEQPNLRSGDKGYMFANRRVAVVRVLPPQISNRKIKDDDYLVTFWVTNGE